jgi:hypothetical protein
VDEGCHVVREINACVAVQISQTATRTEGGIGRMRLAQHCITTDTTGQDALRAIEEISTV